MMTASLLRSIASRSLPVLAILALSTAASAESFWTHPAIKGYGPVHVWPHDALMPDKTTVYKAVFDVTKPSKAPDKVSGALDHVARAVNAFAAAGVPTDHLKYVIILHGPATFGILSEAAYQRKFHVSNPNLKLIEALHKAGVEIYVCGNALADLKFTPKDVDSHVKVALSALSTLIILQDKGYALISM